MKIKEQTLVVLIAFLFGVLITVGVVCVKNKVDYHSKCPAVVVSDTWGNNYCINPESDLLKGDK
jgi:hypothetical protein